MGSEDNGNTTVPDPVVNNDIAERLAGLEEKIEAHEFGKEAEQRALLIDEIHQRIRIKWISLIAGYVIIAFLIILISSVASATIFFGYVKVAPAVIVAALIAPILAMTAITAILLVGAFRSLRDSDIEKVNMPSLTAEAIRAGSGN
jgi:hypothetical protein